MITGLDRVINNLKKYEEDFDRRLAEAMQYEMTRLESYAKSNRPWKDQTGNARIGLRGTSEVSESGARGVIAHTVEYGPCLESNYGGKYSILRQTALQFNLNNIVKILKV